MLHFNISGKSKGKGKILQMLTKTDEVEVKLRFHMGNQKVEVYTLDDTFIGDIKPDSSGFDVLWEMWVSDRNMHTHAYRSHQGKKPSFFIGVWAR